PGEIKLEGTAEDGAKYVTEMFDAWKSGKSLDDFQKSKEPSLIVSDYDWSAGAELKSYELGAAVQNGGNWRVNAEITISTKDKRERKHKVAYAVTLKPAVSIHRADDAEF
ncbi:MAG: hypothetical protein NT069_30405, partial [Planctomycetota bacterium]|nr:hypothetical protein [Planctomycetota bacterium]